MKDIAIKSEDLSIDYCYTFVSDPTCGGNCLFVGSVRNHNQGQNVVKLEFEAYEVMALKKLDAIADACIENFNCKKVCIHHREGTVGIQGIAVIIAVASAHRAEAFAACQFAIDELKKTVPIWKKEFLQDGSYWLKSTP